MPQKITLEEFIKMSGADIIIKELENRSKTDPIIVSDVVDDKYQYVDLVQEGGGVWGIALVGYTYVLEKMGIRFFSLAGTSAGSINAMIQACGGNKEDEKSEKIIRYFLDLDLFKLVDGKRDNWRFTKLVKKLIQRFVLQKKYATNLINFSHWVFVLLITLCLTSFASVFVIGGDAKWIAAAAGVLLLSVIVCGVYIFIRFKNFCKHGYGLNEGTFFHEWLKETIADNHIGGDTGNRKIETLVDFAAHYKKVPPNLKVNPDPRRKDNNPPDKATLSIITSDIISENKIEFPRMWDLYWEKMEDIHPADFVRASMSIPIFFETYSLNNLRKKSQLSIWQKHLNWKGASIPSKAQFIDGGSLSNFPINVFANPSYPVPRSPTFGIRLQSSKTDDASNSNKNIGAYGNSIIGTMRANYDRDFINKNRAFELGVKTVYLKGHNWLNFFIDNEEKATIFGLGAKAAQEFLMEFKWADYKDKREENWNQQHTQDTNPNNFHP